MGQGDEKMKGWVFHWGACPSPRVLPVVLERSCKWRSLSQGSWMLRGVGTDSLLFQWDLHCFPPRALTTLCSSQSLEATTQLHLCSALFLSLKSFSLHDLAWRILFFFLFVFPLVYSSAVSNHLIPPNSFYLQYCIFPFFIFTLGFNFFLSCISS